MTGVGPGPIFSFENVGAMCYSALVLNSLRFAIKIEVDHVKNVVCGFLEKIP